MKVYLDACALNRLTDNQSQNRVHAEAEAVEHILELVAKKQIEWVASIALEVELRRNPDHNKRQDTLTLLSYAGPITTPAPAAIERALHLEALGYGAFDALHLACAEELQATALLTTDDRFTRQAARNLGNPLVKVLNPLNWLRETRLWKPSSK